MPVSLVMIFTHQMKFPFLQILHLAVLFSQQIFVRWYLNIVLVHIFLITDEDKQLFLFDLCFLFCEMPAYAFIFQLACFSDLKFMFSSASYVYCLTAPNSTFSTCSAIKDWLPSIFFFTVSVMLTFSRGFSYQSWYGEFCTFSYYMVGQQCGCIRTISGAVPQPFTHTAYSNPLASMQPSQGQTDYLPNTMRTAGQPSAQKKVRILAVCQNYSTSANM